MGETQSNLNKPIIEDTTTSTLPSPSSFNNEDSIPQIKPSPTKIHKVESYSSLITRCDTPNRYKLTYEDKVFIYDPCLIENTQIPSDIHLLHKSLPQSTPLHHSTTRNDYYHRLIYKNVLTSKRDKTHNTIFIYDWDDTFLPTTFISPRGYTGDDIVIPEKCMEKIKQTEQLVYSLLSKSISKGHVYIVTNSSLGWVEFSAEKFFPSIMELLKSVTIISARNEFEFIHPGDPFHWKYCTFKRIKDNFNEQMVTNLVVMGDSLIEIQAGERIAQQFEECYIKTIKLKESPRIDDINKQLKLVDNEFLMIYSTVKNLTIKIEKKTKS